MHTNQISLLSSYDKLPAFIRLIAIFHLQREFDLDSTLLLKYYANFSHIDIDAVSSGVAEHPQKIHLKNIIIKVLLRLFIPRAKHCEHFNYGFMFENT